MSRFCNKACVFILGLFVLLSIFAMIFMPIEYMTGYGCCVLSFIFINVINNMFKSDMV